MHIAAIRLETLAFRWLCSHLWSRYHFRLSFYNHWCSFFRAGRWDSNHLSDAEILGTQSWIRTTNAFSRYPILCSKLIQCLTRLNGMELHLTSISVLRNVQNLTCTNALFTTRIQSDNVVNGNIVHGRNGIQTLALGYSVCKLTGSRLCHQASHRRYGQCRSQV